MANDLWCFNTLRKQLIRERERERGSFMLLVRL